MNDYAISKEMAERIKRRDIKGVLSCIEEAKAQCSTQLNAMVVVGYGVHYTPEDSQSNVLMAIEMDSEVRAAAEAMAKVNSHLRIRHSREAFRQHIQDRADFTAEQKLNAVIATVYYTNGEQAESIFLRAAETSVQELVA
jgi:hypothetical protein